MNQLNYGVCMVASPKPITTKNHPKAVRPMKIEATCKKHIYSVAIPVWTLVVCCN